MSILGEKGDIITAIGLMSGTSMDGIDAALIKTDGVFVDHHGQSLTIPYPNQMKKRIKQAVSMASHLDKTNSPPKEIADIEREITDLHAAAVNALLIKSGLAASDIDVIGFHGQTIAHRPEKGWTWQIGDGAHLAKETNIAVVNDFRSNDMDNGGQGAPLAPLYHAALLKGKGADNPIAILNMGGVANVSWLDLSDDNFRCVAFDTGPANALLDDWMKANTGQDYDENGNIASQGTTHNDVLVGLMASPYFDEEPPKSLDRDDFSISSVRGLSVEDGASTIADFTVESVVASQSHFPEPVKCWYVCGGGVHNKTIMRRLRKSLPVTIDPVDSLGWKSDALEAEAFAFLAVRNLRSLALSHPETTGCSEPVTGGVYHGI